MKWLFFPANVHYCRCQATLTIQMNFMMQRIAENKNNKQTESACAISIADFIRNTLNQLFKWPLFLFICYCLWSRKRPLFSSYLSLCEHFFFIYYPLWSCTRQTTFYNFHQAFISKAEFNKFFLFFFSFFLLSVHHFHSMDSFLLFGTDHFIYTPFLLFIYYEQQFDTWNQSNLNTEHISQITSSSSTILISFGHWKKTSSTTNKRVKQIMCCR